MLILRSGGQRLLFFLSVSPDFLAQERNQLPESGLQFNGFQNHLPVDGFGEESA